MNPITLYSKPGCVQCDASRRYLDRKGVEYAEVDLTQDPAALELVRSLGYLQAPVIVAGTRSWSGYRPDELAAIETVRSA